MNQWRACPQTRHLPFVGGPCTVRKDSYLHNFWSHYMKPRKFWGGMTTGILALVTGALLKHFRHEGSTLPVPFFIAGVLVVGAVVAIQVIDWSADRWIDRIFDSMRPDSVSR